MSEEDQLEITTFCQFAHSIVNQIQTCPIHFQNLLTLSLLDSLSKSVSPKKSKNRDRFMALIDEHADWSYRNYVSLTQLSFLIKENTDLQKFITDKILHYQNGKILRPEEADIQFDDLIQHCSSNEIDLVKKARYVSLLWTLRNSLSHSFMPPGNGWAISRNNSTPYYFHNITDSKWELYIHPDVLLSISISTINNLGLYFNKNDLNPYNSFSWISNWFDV